MKTYIRSIQWSAILFMFLGPVCAIAQAPNPLPPVRLTVPPNTTSPITIKTIPDALCVIRPEDSQNAPSSRIISNQNGTVRFFVQPIKRSNSRLLMQCEANGESARQVIELHADFVATPDMPFPISVPEPIPGSRILPELPRNDALRLSNEELLERGYPIRPDPTATPQALEEWLNAVSKPITIIPPHLVPAPYIRNRPMILRNLQSGFVNSRNWSGVAVLGPNGTYNVVSAFWNVPSVTAEPGQNDVDSSIWVGFDGTCLPGYSCEDVWQAGTQQESISSGGMQITSYSSWAETFPQVQCFITSLFVSPGDRFHVSAVMGTSGSPPVRTVFFYFDNLTSGTSEIVDARSLPGPCTPSTGLSLVGDTAEWIVERPEINGRLSTLAHYSPFPMDFAIARRSNDDYVFCCNADRVVFTMVDDSRVISTFCITGPSSMRFFSYPGPVVLCPRPPTQ